MIAKCVLMVLHALIAQMIPSKSLISVFHALTLLMAAQLDVFHAMNKTISSDAQNVMDCTSLIQTMGYVGNVKITSMVPKDVEIRQHQLNALMIMIQC